MGALRAESDRATAIYLDHGATSWPKPDVVGRALQESVELYGGNPGRGAYRLALDTSRAILKSRRDIAQFLGVRNDRDLLFQPGCTQAMNLMLLGLIEPGDRVVAGFAEHNAVARPLNTLATRGVEVVMASPDESGVVDVDEVEQLVRAAPTRAVVCQHAGNLTGAIQPVADLADVAHANGALLLVDGAQAGGHLPVDLGALGADAWACAGHKGLLGPQGIGVLYLAPGCEPEPLVSGGTGAGASEEPLQPRVRPDLYEAGTPNTPGILALGAAVRWLAERADTLRVEEQRLARRLHEGLLAIDGFRVLGPGPGEPRVPIVAAVHERVEVDRIAFALDRRYGIAVRAGLHCAPWAHEALGTLQTGALRFGVGYGNTSAQVDEALAAVAEIVREHS
jgi:cysteine desulfurase family protein